jgi:radical SAM protein with 4Fe4S-binding SPASM domain
MKEQFFIQWHITNLCNLRCRHCYQDDFSKTEDLDWPGLRKISDNILSTIKQWDKTACIHLTGGEPLLKKEIFLLLDHLDQQPTVEELGIITNGLLFDRDVIERVSLLSKLRKIKISLDGANAETHDSIRGKGTFQRVIQNLPLIKREGRFEIILMFTVMRRNFRNLLSLLNLCGHLGVDGLILERFIPWGRGREMIDEVLDKKEWKELVETLLEFFSMKGDDVFPYQAFQVIFGGEETELSGAPCVIGRDGLCIMPEGSVFPCRRFPISMGNVLSNSLKQVWEKSEILEKLRRKENLKGRCGRCEIKDCRGCRSLALALTGDYLGEDPHCQYHFKVLTEDESDDQMGSPLLHR